jgi:hypothetical protein
MTPVPFLEGSIKSKGFNFSAIDDISGEVPIATASSEVWVAMPVMIGEDGPLKDDSIVVTAVTDELFMLIPLRRKINLEG